MSKRQLIMLLGAIVLILPFLGFPPAWKQIFSVITGILLVSVAYRMPAAMKARPKKDVPYVEEKSPAVPQGSPISPPPPVSDIINTNPPPANDTPVA